MRETREGPHRRVLAIVEMLEFPQFNPLPHDTPTNMCIFTISLEYVKTFENHRGSFEEKLETVIAEP